MDEVLEKWNKRWYPYCLKLVFLDLRDDIKDFLKHIVFSHIEVILFAKKRTVKIVVFHKKTKQKHSIIVNEWDSLISKDFSFIKWNEFFAEHLKENKEKSNFNQTLHQLFMDFGISAIFK